MKFKKFLSLALSLMLILSVAPMGLFSITACAETATSGTTGDCTWTLDGTVLTISGNGRTEDSIDGSSPWSSKNITEVIINDGVINIGEGNFWYCENLTKVTIPNSVTSIGLSAFAHCQSLTNISIPDSVTIIGDGVFYDCTGLTNIIIPDGVISIGEKAFYDCTGLTSVTIPDSITDVDSYAFDGCDNITDITISQSLINRFKTVFKKYNKIKNITLDENTVYISELAFSGCSGLENIYLSDGVTSIGNYAFYGCKNLAGVSIPDSLTNIGNYAFYRCSALKNITIPQSVTKIEDYAFKDTDPELKIFTVENSAAHKFAIKNNKNYYLTELTSPVLSPIVEDIRNNDNKSVEVRLENNEGYEYKCDDGEWQTSSVFEIFNYNSYHNFYQRIAETEKHVKSKETGIEGIYLKNKNINIPEAPEIALKSYNSISLKSVPGYEYSIDGDNWQTSPIFVGLLPAAKYFMYQREAETPTCFAGAASAALIVRTPEKAGDINGDGVIDIRDLISLKKFFVNPSNNIVSSECLDVSGDGRINSADLAALRKNLLLQ